MIPLAAGKTVTRTAVRALDCAVADSAVGASMPEGLTIGRLAKAVGVNVETIRYYQRRGLIAEPAKPPGGHRRYSPRVIEQIGFIRRAQQLGFSLDDAKHLLSLADGTHCREARLLAEKKLELVEVQLARLEKMRSELDVLITACRGNRSRKDCPLIDALKRGP